MDRSSFGQSASFEPILQTFSGDDEEKAANKKPYGGRLEQSQSGDDQMRV
jgi:hypothetical protein